MEKRKPHYNLSKLKKLFASSENTRIITNKAKKGATSLGYMDDESMLEVVACLEMSHFKKSMTVYTNNKLWQDVFIIQHGDCSLYIKIQESTDGQSAILIQFKKDDGADQ